MTIRRNTAARALLALAMAGALGACEDAPLQSAAATAPAAQSRAGAGADVARALAAGLGDAEVRAAVHAALRQSPLNEHKLALREFVQTAPGQALVKAAAARGGLTESTLRGWIAGLGATDFYLPMAAHRDSWRGTQPVLVGYTANVDEPRLTSYDAAGAAHLLDARDGVPAQVLLILHPGEPTWVRRDARGAGGLRASLLDDDESCPPMTDNCEHGGTGGGSGEGPWAQLTGLRAFEGDFWGDIEVMIKHYDAQGGTQIEEWIDSGYDTWTQYAPNVYLAMDSDSTTWVKVWERDSGYPETGDDDFWGEGWMGLSGQAKTFIVNNVLTIELKYTY